MQPDPWDISEVQLAHRLGSTSAQFDDPNLLTSAGPLPSLALALQGGGWPTYANLRATCGACGSGVGHRSRPHPL